MTEPTRTSTGIAYLTFDATINTDASMIIQQKLDLSGNTSVQTFCENAFNLAAERDTSEALLADSDITDYGKNYFVYLGSNDLNVQKTYLSANENSSIAQNIACNAYDMSVGKNNQIPLVSNVQSSPEPEPEPEPIPEPEPQPEPIPEPPVLIGYNISTIGTGFNNPQGVSLDSSGNVYIADYSNSCIRMINAVDGSMSTIAGTAGSPGHTGDGGLATGAKLNYPTGVAVDSTGNVYIADNENHCIRMIDASTDNISTIAGTAGSDGYSGDGGAATDAELYQPYGVAVDSTGNVYIADRGNNRIRKLDASGNISTIAGTGDSGYSGDGGAATSAELNLPQGVTLNSSGNLYISDTSNQCVRKVDMSTGNISTIAGTGSAGHTGDGGPASDARLRGPTALALDSTGNVYIADYWNHCIRMIDASTGYISTIAGTAGSAGFSGDGGDATSAQLERPYGVALDSSGNVYIADRKNDCIRKLTPIYG